MCYFLGDEVLAKLIFLAKSTDMREEEAGGESHVNPHAEEGVAPSERERKVIAGPQGHHRHLRVRLQAQIIDGLQDPGHCPVPARCQYPHLAAHTTIPGHKENSRKALHSDVHPA